MSRSSSFLRDCLLSEPSVDDCQQQRWQLFPSDGMGRGGRGREKDLWQTVFYGHYLLHPLKLDWFLCWPLQLADSCQLLAKGGSGLFSWFNLSCSSHKLWQGILRAKVAAIACTCCVCLTIASFNIKLPDSFAVGHQAVHTCSDTHFQIKFLVILYWLSPESIYIVPLQLCHKALY